MIVRVGYRIDGEVVEDQAEGPAYEATLARLPEREEQRLWIAVDR